MTKSQNSEFVWDSKFDQIKNFSALPLVYQRKKKIMRCRCEYDDHTVHKLTQSFFTASLLVNKLHKDCTIAAGSEETENGCFENRPYRHIYRRFIRQQNINVTKRK